MKKALFFDIDGTLIYDKNEIPEKMFSILRKWQMIGNYVFAITGRSLRKFKQLKTDFQWDGYALHNGSKVILNGNIISVKQIKLSKIKWILSQLEQCGYDYGLEYNERFFSNFSEKDILDKHSLNLSLLPDNDVNIDKLIIMSQKLPSFLVNCMKHFNIVLMDKKFFCITHKYANKLTACRKIISSLNLKRSGCYYFGNDQNDLVALEYFVNSIVVSNSSLKVSNKCCVYVKTYSDLENYILSKF